MALRVSSFNCNSLRKHIDIVRQLTANNDIILLQEVLLIDDDSHFIQAIDPDFEFALTPSIWDTEAELAGRPRGGLAILWRKSLNITFSPVFYDSNMMGIKLNFNSKSH